MNKLAEKLNKKHGFVYEVDGTLYCIGQALLIECKGSITLLYKDFTEAQKKGEYKIASDIYKILIRKSESHKDDKGNSLEIEEFINRITPEGYISLEKQVDRFSELYRKYALEY